MSVYRANKHILQLEELCAPKLVLLYGAGELGKWTVQHFMQTGINIIAFIDQRKKGKWENLPIYSIQEARQLFRGDNIVVVVCIANQTVFYDVRSTLQESGFKQVYSYDCLDWILVDSEKCYCKELFHYARLFPNGLAQCCNWGENRVFIPELFSEGRSFAESCERYLDKLEYYFDNAKEGRIPLFCANCPYLEKWPVNETDNKITAISFAASVSCNLRCVYCTAITPANRVRQPYDAKQYGEMFLELLENLEKKQNFTLGATISFAGGEISTQPIKHALYRFAQSHPQFRYEFLTNCVVYDEGISELLAISKENYILCDIDAGCRNSYMLVKGFDYFNCVVRNIRSYVKAGAVLLKYIVIPDYNTSDADYTGTLELLSDFGISSLVLSWDVQRSYDTYSERRALYEIAHFMKMLYDNGINVSLEPTVFSRRQISQINALAKTEK